MINRLFHTDTECSYATVRHCTLFISHMYSMMIRYDIFTCAQKLMKWPA